MACNCGIDIPVVLRRMRGCVYVYSSNLGHILHYHSSEITERDKKDIDRKLKQDYETPLLSEENQKGTYITVSVPVKVKVNEQGKIIYFDRFVSKNDVLTAMKGKENA